MKETSSIRNILANSQLFQGIAEEGLDTLVAVSRRETYEAGDIILVDHAHRQGEAIFRTGEPVELRIDRDSLLVLAA